MTAAVKHEPLPDFLWVEHLPRLEIIHAKTKMMGPITQVHYTIRSASRLSESDFDWLLGKGFLLKGELFYCYSQHDGDESVEGRWTVSGKDWVPFYRYEVMCQAKT